MSQHNRVNRMEKALGMHGGHCSFCSNRKGTILCGPGEAGEPKRCDVCGEQLEIFIEVEEVIVNAETVADGV